MNFKLDIDSKSIINEDINNSFQMNFNKNIFSVELDKIDLENLNQIFREEFSPKLIENFSVESKKVKLDLDNLFQEEFVPPKTLSFDVCVNENLKLNDESFLKYFNLENFKVCLDGSKNISDKLFSENFKIELEPEIETVEVVKEIKNIFEISLDFSKKIDDVVFESYFKPQQKHDYNSIQKLRNSFNSRKILTRDEREEIVDIEPLVSDIEVDKKDIISLDESFQESASSIKENAFYKIVEVDKSDFQIPEIPAKVDTSYKEEFDKKIIDMESKYEDLLQKTKDDYESRLGKMFDDFSNFRNQVNQQVNRLSFISSSAGGGVVRMLDLIDVNKTDLQNGRSLVYNSSTGKFDFAQFSAPETISLSGMNDVDVSNNQDGGTLIYNSETQKFEIVNLENYVSQSSFDKMETIVFQISETDLTNGYLQLSSTPDNRYYNLSEVQINGLVNSHYPNHYSFIANDRIDISNLNLTVGDEVRIFYIKS